MIDRLRRRVSLLREHEQLLMISISTVLVMAGQGVISPVLPLFARSFGVGAATIGLTLSFFALARLVLNVPLGILSDRRGRRLLLVAGPLVTAVGMVGSGFAGDIATLLAWRVVAGAGSAMYMTGAQVYLVDISGPATRARFIATNQGALLLGVAIGPAIGGPLADTFGFRAPFFVVGGAALVAAFYAWRRIPETRHLAVAEAPKAPVAGERRAWVSLLVSRDFLAVAVVTMAIFFTRTGSRLTLMPLFGADRLGMSASALGGVFTVMALINMAGVAPAAWLADTVGRKWAIVPSGLVTAGALVVMALASSLPVFLGAAVLLAIGTSIAGPAPAAYAADIAPPALRGLAMGLYRSAGDIGFVVGPPLLGAIADATSIGWGLAVNGVLVAGAAIGFGVLARETMVPRTQPADAG